MKRASFDPGGETGLHPRIKCPFINKRSGHLWAAIEDGKMDKSEGEITFPHNNEQPTTRSQYGVTKGINTCERKGLFVKRVFCDPTWS
ncbi:hypothetical protein NPIL_100021 [Nephila pilipes]|uniref:Uncharacterized protein n=1 Tax=Nephila pilipes TaxID=299642 RepID=A0A8X6TK96_NEPPI|nr:hypothetical protein NPIL_100021 [Nephila pilipes]